MFIGKRVRFIALVVCCTTLGCGEDPTVQLIARLKDSDVESRRAAVQALEQYPSKRVTMALASAIEDADTVVREMAIRSLGQRGEQAKIILPQLELTLQHSDPGTRLSTAMAIRQIDSGGDLHIPIFIEALRGGELRALLELGDKGADDAWAVPALIELLSHRNPRLRALSARTLGRLGPVAQEASAALQNAENDRQANVRKMSQQALSRIETPQQ